MKQKAHPENLSDSDIRSASAISEMNQWLLDNLDMLVSLGRNLNLDPSHGTGTQAIFNATKSALQRVTDFSSLGFMLTDEDGLDFLLAACEPIQDKTRLSAEFERHIEEGTFAYVLNQNRPLILPALTLEKRTVILHVLATQARVLGMFLGIASDPIIPDAAQKLVSAILFHAASALEAARLYDRLNTYAHNLEIEIEERKKTQQVLCESQEMLQSVMNHIPLAIFWKDPEGKYLGCNRRFADDAGLSKTTDILGKTIHDLPWASLADDHKKAESIVFLSNTSLLNLEEHVANIENKEIWHRASRVPLHDAQGNTKAVLGIYEDISEQKRALIERARLEDQLRQSQKLEAIGTLAGGIAHDFNNILSAIIGYAELGLSDANITATAKENMAEVFRAAQRAKDLVKQILTFSRQIEPERKPIQLHAVVQEALKLLRASLPATINIQAEINPDSGHILADETQIHQVVMNLCTNAYHAMQNTGGRLTVLVNVIHDWEQLRQRYRNLQPGEYVHLRVSDTGCGMPPEVQERIFEPFFTTKPIGQGTGMGLSTVHGIIKALNGFIDLQSRVDQGTTFDLYFPRVSAAPVSPAAPVDDADAGAENVLFVDDEEVLASLGKRSLERFGYHVTLRTSSVEALELFKSKPADFDILITDQTMPNMTGLQLAQEILLIRPNFPVIIATGFSETVENRIQDLGISQVVMKPFLAKDMHQAIRAAFREKRA